MKRRIRAAIRRFVVGLILEDYREGGQLRILLDHFDQGETVVIRGGKVQLIDRRCNDVFAQIRETRDARKARVLAEIRRLG